jgi:endonuclease YncB( thermonuclease family)
MRFSATQESDSIEKGPLCAVELGRGQECGRPWWPTIRCEHRDVDRYGRVVAVCFGGSEELNRWMVANGWAVAFRRYSLDYVADEDTARRNRTNIWSGAFDMPWDWRRQNPNQRPSP